MSGSLLDDDDYDRRLLARMQRDMGRTDNPSWGEQRGALLGAAGTIGQTAFELLVPQSPADLALYAAMGPGSRALRVPLTAGLLALGEGGDAAAGPLDAATRAARLARTGTRAAGGAAAAEAPAAAAAPARTRRRGTVGIEPAEVPPVAPRVQPAAVREEVSRADEQDRGLREWLDARPDARPPRERPYPAGEDFLGLRNYDLTQVPDVPQTPLWRYQPARGVSGRMADLVSNPEVERLYSEIVRHGRDNLQGREWYNMDPVRFAFIRELGPERGNAAFRDFMNNIAAASPRSNIIDNMRNGAFYFVQGATGQPIPNPVPHPWGHLAQNNHRANVETIRGPGWNLRENPKPPSFMENLSGNQRPGTMDAHALLVPSILARDPRFLATGTRVQRVDPETGGKTYVNFAPQASYGRGVFTMDEAVRRPPLWESAPRENEYAALENWFGRIAEREGMTTAQAQASGWVGGGRISGLQSPPLPAAEILQRVVNRNAADRGVDPREVMHDLIWQQQALRALAPVGTGAGVGAGLLADEEQTQ